MEIAEQMILSMTGYGEAQYSEDGVSYALEIRSVNGRYLKIAIKLPESLALLEPEVENLFDDLRARRLRMGPRDWGLVDQPRLPLAFKGAPPDIEQRAGDPEMPTGLPDIPDLLGVLKHQLLSADIALRVGHGLPPASQAT